MNSNVGLHFVSPIFNSEVKWSLPAIAKHSECGLSSVSVTALRKCLKPVIEGLENIDAAELLCLKTVPKGCGPKLKAGASVRPIHEHISPMCDSGTVRYIHLSEVDGQYSMGVFVFPPHSKIPLHDHPGMCVLSRVLYGQLERTSLDLSRQQPLQEPELDPASPSTWVPWTKSMLGTKRRRASEIPKGAKLAFRNRVDTLSAPDCTILYPYEGNLHEFVAGPHGAAVLDVLLPPYDHEHHRDCTFYEIRECSEKVSDSDRDQVWIIPTEQPEDFHCISGMYDGLE